MIALHFLSEIHLLTSCTFMCRFFLCMDVDVPSKRIDFDPFIATIRLHSHFSWLWSLKNLAGFNRIPIQIPYRPRLCWSEASLSIVSIPHLRSFNIFTRSAYLCITDHIFGCNVVGFEHNGVAKHHWLLNLVDIKKSGCSLT